MNGSQVFDRAIVDVRGVATRRTYVSRYDAAGKFVSQGYVDSGPAAPNEIRSGTWQG